MTNDLVQQNDAGFLAVVEKLANNPNINVEVISRMLDMQERIMAKNAEMSFNNAMADMQEELPMIDKTAKAHNSKYAKLESIHAQISPVLKKFGFSLSFDSVFEEKVVIVTGTLSHREGHSKSSNIRLPIDNSGSKNDVQGMGSTISYARRYLLGMLLNIVTKDEDDDGNAMKFITIEQAADLDERLNKCGANKAAFLKIYGATDIRSLPAAKLSDALARISKKEADVKVSK